MPSSVFPISAVLFDLDNTLNDRQRSWYQYTRLLARPEAGLLSARDVDFAHRLILDADHGGYRPKNDLFEELSKTLPWTNTPAQDQLERHWRQHFSQCMVVREGVLKVLSTLHERDLRLGIVSNGRTEFQNRKIDAMGLRRWMDLVVISESAGVKKPDPGIFRLALKSLGTAPTETLFVGDHPKLDVWGPAQLGMRTAWLDTGFPYPPDLARADYEIRSFIELCGVMAVV